MKRALIIDNAYLPKGERNIHDNDVFNVVTSSASNRLIVWRWELQEQFYVATDMVYRKDILGL